MKMRMKAEMLWRWVVSRDAPCFQEEKTYKQITLQRMMISKWKMFAMPSAKQRIMQSTPVLVMGVLAFAHSVRRESGCLRIPLSVYTYEESS